MGHVIGLAGIGGPEVLQLQTLPRPTPGKGQILIEVAAAGVNRPDIAQREGRYPVPIDASPILGLEVSGRILALGDGVTTFATGDLVCALVHGGGYAEYALADAETTLPIPSNFPLIDAAGLPEVSFTVELNMIRRAALKPGETVLIHGGSSGIGSYAIERAKALGATVIVTAGSTAKCDWCRALGADHAINYRDEDFVEAVLSVTGGVGANVVLDMVGGPYVDRNLKAMANDGRCAIISLQAGSEVTADFNELLRRRLTLVGATLRPLPTERKAELARDILKNVWPLIESNALNPRARLKFALEDAADAHRAMEAPNHMGKIILLANTKK